MGSRRCTGRGRSAAHALAREEGHAEGRAEGHAESLLAVLDARGLAVTAAERTAILHERDVARLHRWVGRIATCASVAELLAD